MRITSKTKILGLLGYQVEYSLSPYMHNAAFEELNLDYVYLVFSVVKEDLKKAIEGLKALDFRGANVTIPHKEEVIKYLDELSKEAELIGAVNTIVYKDNRLIGYNTDGIGFLKSLKKEIEFPLKGKKIFILGAGGAGKACAVSLALEEISKISLSDKIEEKAEKLSSYLRERFSCESRSFKLNRKEFKEEIKNSDIIINATPVGIKEDDPLLIDAKDLREGQLFYDLIYKPKETKLLKLAKKKNLKTINGLMMLLYQGGESFRLWMEREAPLKVMKEALDKMIE
jgi:shikimate dehydrogenase